MKIAQIIYTGFGGLGSVAFSLITADKQQQYAWQIGFIGDKELDISYPSLCKTNNVKFSSFQSIPGRPYRAWIALARWLGKTKPEVVICHSINSILACRWYAWLHNAQLIAVEHTPNQVKTRSEWAASRASMLLADRVIVLTEGYKEELRQAHGWLFRPNKIRIIPNGIDMDIFYPKQTQSSENNSVIKLGMAARFSFSKRQDILISVIEKLSILRPNLIWELRLAGNGSEFERIQMLAQNSKANAHIKFDGLLSENEIASWLRELDIYVHATEGETLSTSLLQAMATGLPIVASDIPGVSNLLYRESEYGVCVANDTDAFSQAILHLIDQPTKRTILGRQAKKRVFENYSNQVMLRSYMEVIESCKK